MTSIFGRVVTGADVETAARDTLALWFKTYLRQLELDNGLTQDILPIPQQYLISEELDQQQGDRFPSIVLISPGLNGQPPKMEGDGTYRSFWNLGVGVIVSANDQPETKRLVRLYTAVTCLIMIQNRSLGQFADGLSWLDESYDDSFPFSDEQTISAGVCVFEVEVANSRSRHGGPALYGQPPVGPDPVTQPGSQDPVIPDRAHVIPTVETKE